MEVSAGRSRRVVTAERRLMVRVTAGAHVAAGRETLVAGAWVRRIGWLAAGTWSTARTHAQHVRLVSGSELFTDSFAILQHGQSRRARLQHSINVYATDAVTDLVMVYTRLTVLFW